MKGERKVRLTKLEIENFRALKNYTLELPLDKKTTVLSGKNGSGKSTIIDAIFWLLCDETLVYGCQNSDNLDKNDRKLPVNVCGYFIKDNGESLKLRRKLTPKFNKAGEFSKYETELEINDAEYSVKQYFARLKNEEFGILQDNDPDVTSFNTLRCILDYNYLNIIKYQTAREKIEKILKITKDDEFANNPEYSLIKDDLKAQLYDIAKVKTKFNKQKDLAEAEVITLNKNYELLKNAYKPLDQDELEKLENQKRIISEKEYEHSVEYKVANDKNNELQKQLKLAYAEYLESENTYNNILKDYKKIEDSKKYYKNQLDGLREKFINIKNSTTKCPNCSFELNGKEIKVKLDEINKQGAEINSYVNGCDSKLKEFDLDNIEKTYNEAKKKYKAIMQQVDESSYMLKEIIDKENNQSKIFYNEKAIKLAEIEGQIIALKSSSNVLALEDKESELKVARQELAKVEQKIALLKEFEINKNKAVNIRINEVFPNLDFRLYEESDSGAIQNTCKVYLKNVGFEGVNTGHKIMLGFEILNSLRKALGVKESLPFIFDNVSDLDKENFNKIVSQTKNQVITAIASDEQEIKVMNL